MLVLAMEWAKVERVLPRARMIPGETRRDRVLTVDEENGYFQAAQLIGSAGIEYALRWSAHKRSRVGTVLAHF